MTDPRLSIALLDALVCPACRDAVDAGPEPTAIAWLHCRGCGRYYPVLDGIPVMLRNRAASEPPKLS